MKVPKGTFFYPFFAILISKGRMACDDKMDCTNYRDDHYVATARGKIMRKIGYHTSLSKGWVKAMEEVSAYGADTFQFFSRNPRGSRGKAIDEEDIETFERMRKDFGPVVCHGAYTMNLASSRDDVRKKSIALLRDDMKRMARYPEDTVYVFHPGNHTGAGIEEGIRRIIEGMETIREDFPDRRLALETMSGRGSEVGSRFEELNRIVDALKDDRIGVVLDTCHLFGAGYDLKNPERVLADIEETVGVDKIFAVHVNDSEAPFGAKKDRHALLGAGEIGIEVLGEFLRALPLAECPFILETPGKGEDHKKEIAILRGML